MRSWARKRSNRAPGPPFLYTLVHYVAFICVGLGVSWVLSRIQTIPNLFLGFVLSFGFFDLVFYTSVTVTGVDAIGEFGWPAVLMGNLIARVSLMSFLHYTGETPPIPWWTIFGESKVFKEGLIAGLVGAGTARRRRWAPPGCLFLDAEKVLEAPEIVG